MMTIEMTKKENIFFDAYLQAIDFTESGNSKWCAVKDLDEDFLRQSAIDCLAFYSRIQCFLTDDDIEGASMTVHAGHDFWLTRNGRYLKDEWNLFGDRSEIYGKFTESLAKHSENFGVVDAYFEGNEDA